MDIDQKMIPPEVVEAAMKEMPFLSFDKTRAAIAAAIAAWPDAWVQTVMNKPMCLSLPFTTEKQNDNG